MPFNDTPQGSTHHDKDACYKCEKCKQHFFLESHLQRHVCLDEETLKGWSEEADDMQTFDTIADNNDLTNK